MNSELRNYLRKLFFSICCGILAGLAATLFLVSLDIATKTRFSNMWLIWLLPLAGLLIGLTYHYYGKDISIGTNLILDEIHDPKKIVPIRMAPLILLSTIVTHLFGGSAGREGTAVQMGASLSDQLSRLFEISSDERRMLLMVGAGAGFGAAIGTPWAGAIFGMEVLFVGRFKLYAAAECVIASFTAYLITLLLHAPHSQYPAISIESFQFKIAFFILIAGFIFGLAARFFMFVTHVVEKTCARLIPFNPARPFIAGVVIVILFYIEGTYRFAGLGIETIQNALSTAGPLSDPIFKTFFTALTIGSGFKGGEFIPLVFIGTTLGSALTIILPISFQLLASVGFASVFAGASNTPIACTIMAIEIFGLPIAPYALIGCFGSFLFSGNRGIYLSQKLNFRKFL